VMNISKSSRTHYNTVAGLTLEMFKEIKYEISIFILLQEIIVKRWILLPESKRFINNDK
jgi:hypothetical protein